jgi:hypothetical protein
MANDLYNKVVSFPSGSSSLKTGGGSGTFDGMEARVAKLEAAVEHIQRDTAEIKTDVRTLRDNARTDFHKVFGAIITVALGLAALMAKGFHWLNLPKASRFVPLGRCATLGHVRQSALLFQRWLPP